MIGDDSLGLVAAPREPMLAKGVRGEEGQRVSHRWARPGLSSRRSGEEDTFSPHFFLAFSLLFAFLAFLYFYPPPFILSPFLPFYSLFPRRRLIPPLIHILVASWRYKWWYHPLKFLLDPASATLTIDVFRDRWEKEEHKRLIGQYIFIA